MTGEEVTEKEVSSALQQPAREDSKTTSSTSPANSFGATRILGIISILLLAGTILGHLRNVPHSLSLLKPAGKPPIVVSITHSMVTILTSSSLALSG